MRQYIYFFDTQSILLCENADDALYKITMTRARTPNRKWALVEMQNDGEYHIILRSDKQDKKPYWIVTGVIILVCIAIAVFVAAYLTGVLF